MDLNKLNKQLYNLTFCPQTIPLMAQKFSNKRMHLNFKQYKRSICNNGDMLLHIMKFREKFPRIDDIMASPLANYINLAANDCGYSGTTDELIVSYVHLLVLKAKLREQSELV